MSRSSLIDSTSLSRLRRRLLFGLGGVSLAIGVVMLTIGLVGYFSHGQSTAPQESAAVLAPQPPTSINDVENLPAAIPDYDPKRTASEPEPQLAVPVRLVIESIGVDAPVSTYGLDSDAVPTVPTGADAAEVVAWYDFSALPGAGSNAIFSGHVTWEGSAVFWSLDQLQVGDTIRVQAEDGREYVYEVSANSLVDASDPDSLKVMAATATDTVTIITCGGTWIPDPSDTVAGGAYTSRTVVQGRLVQTSLAVPVPSTISEDEADSRS